MTTPSGALLGAASLFLLSHPFALAAEGPPPTLVSPGSAHELEVVESRCPTFSWAGLPRSTAQELVIYEVGEAGVIETDPTLTVRLPALASSWTPPRVKCLEPGKSYAWTLRASGDSERSEWAEALFFSVPAGPSENDLRAALEVVRSYAALHDIDPGTAARTSDRSGDRGGKDEENAESLDSRTRVAQAGVITNFRVASGGDVEAVSFAGDGSALYNIGSTALAIDSVGPSEIRENAVSSDEIVADAVAAIHITANAVGSSEIASNAVGASEMAGSFCLVRRGGNSCPAGYEEFFIKFDTEDTSNDDICTEEVALCPNLYSEIYLSFCCA